MDWLILILGVPAILIPLVLLLGFTGCYATASSCFEDSDCPVGAQCVDGSCVLVGEPDAPPLSAPENLAAIALDDQSVLLTWTNTDPAATDFQIERSVDDGEEPKPVSPSGTISPSGTTDNSGGLHEGLIYVYRVRALADGQPPSDPSEISSATVLPATPVNFTATVAGINQIDLSWTNASTVATEFSLERRDLPGGAFTEIVPGPGANNTFFDTTGLTEGTTYEYRVSTVVDGFENSVQQPVKSLPSAIQSVTIAFTTAFTAPPGTLTTDQASAVGQGICLVQRLSPTLLTPSATGSLVRIVLRGSNTGSLTLDRVTISKVGVTGDPYDAALDLIDVTPGVTTTIPPNTPVTVGPVNYTLDPTQDLLVAVDISNTPGEGNLRFGALTGAETFARAATAEAGVQDRTSGYITAANNLFLVEKIEVL